MRKSNFFAIFALNMLLLILFAFENYSASGILAFLRITLGFIYLLFVPGYALQAALFPRQGHLASLDRLAFSIGLSVAIMPILGLTLDGPPGGIFLWQSFIFLTAITILCGLVALYRRSSFSGEQVNLDATELNLRGWWESQTLAGHLLFALVPAAVVVGFVIILYVLTASSPDKQFTEFYMVGTTDVATNYPIEVKTGQPFTLKVGVANHEGQGISYSIRAQMNAQILAGTAPFILSDDQSTALDMTLSASTPGDQQLMEILLLRDNQTYRRLYLWLNVKSP